jgi:lipopolysaccharide export system permease protein
VFFAGLRGDWDAGGVTLPPGVPDNAKTIHFSGITAELNERIAYAFSILLMPFFAAPLGITSPRSSRFAGPAVGLLGILAYQKMLEFTGKGAAAGKIPAATSIWLVFIAFAALTALLFWSTSRSTGMTPFNKFENLLADITHTISMKLTSKRGTAGAKA